MLNPVLPVLTPDQSAAWDRKAVAGGIELATLMECAGRAVAAVLAATIRRPAARRRARRGRPGHNGGDGWVLARALHRLDVPVWVTAPPGDAAPSSASAWPGSPRAEGVREVAPDGPWPTVGLAVDALLGTGASGPPRAPVAALLERLLDLEVPLVAVDGPTGVDLLSGTVHGAARADLTVTFGGVRRGHLLARDEVGDVRRGRHRPSARRARLARRSSPTTSPRSGSAGSAPTDHKGTRGRVVVVGGDAGMTGAIRMAARAAFAAGAGLVHAVAPAGDGGRTGAGGARPPDPGASVRRPAVLGIARPGRHAPTPS